MNKKVLLTTMLFYSVMGISSADNVLTDMYNNFVSGKKVSSSAAVPVTGAREENTTWGSKTADNPRENYQPSASKPAEKRVVKKAVKDNVNNFAPITEEATVVEQPQPKKVAVKPKKVEKTEKVVSTASTRPAKASKVKESEEEYLGPITTPAPEEIKIGPTIRKKVAKDTGDMQNANGCAYVNRSWDGVISWAKAGDTERAYNGFLSILNSCNDEKVQRGTIGKMASVLPVEYMEKLNENPMLASPVLGVASETLQEQLLYAYAKNNDLEKAKAIFNNNYQKFGNNPSALEIGGWVAQNEKNYKQAEGLFRRSLKMDNSRNGARQGLVLSLSALGKYDMAATEFAKLSPEFADPIGTDFYAAQAENVMTQLEDSDSEKKDYREVIKYLKKAESYGPSARTLDLNGRIAMDQKDYVKAKKIYGNLMAKNAPNADVNYTRAVVAMGDWDSMKKMGKSENEEVQKLVKAPLDHYYTATGQIDKVDTDAYRESMNNIKIGAESRSKSGDFGTTQLKQSKVKVDAIKSMGDDTALTASITGSSASDGIRKATLKQAQLGFVAKGDDGKLEVKVGQSQATPDKVKGVKAKSVNVATGELAYTSYNDSGYNKLSVKREAVEDTVTAINKGLAKTTVALDGKVLNDADTSVNYRVAAGNVSGKSAKNNSFLHLEGWYQVDKPNDKYQWLSYAPGVRYETWNSDQNDIEHGGDGYYSPKTMADVGVKFDVQSKDSSKANYKVGGLVGYTNRSNSTGTGSSSGGLLEVEGQYNWLLNKYLILNAKAGLEYSPGYQEYKAYVGIKIPFDPVTTLKGSNFD